MIDESKTRLLESAGVLTMAVGQIHDPQREKRCVPLPGTERDIDEK
jgi:hypothetical protein